MKGMLLVNINTLQVRLAVKYRVDLPVLSNVSFTVASYQTVYLKLTNEHFVSSVLYIYLIRCDFIHPLMLTI